MSNTHTNLHCIEIVTLLRVYIKNRNTFYLKSGNLENFRIFISWYLGRNAYEKYVPNNNNDNNTNLPWYIGNYELHTLAGILNISVLELYETIKSLE